VEALLAKAVNLDSNSSITKTFQLKTKGETKMKKGTAFLGLTLAAIMAFSIGTSEANPPLFSSNGSVISTQPSYLNQNLTDRSKAFRVPKHKRLRLHIIPQRDRDGTSIVKKYRNNGTLKESYIVNPTKGTKTYTYPFSRTVRN
jgi:hypothetical protein